ncbi:hypothetical protein BH23CHL10_BH23CHL10_15920 [soil metagenome]
MTAPDAGSVLRRALIAWGLGHLALGRTTRGWTLLAAEAISLLLVGWLTIGLADSSAYLVPFLAGFAFIVAWAWQAVDAYRTARGLQAATPPTPIRSPAAAIGWLSLPLLAWGTGFWLIGAHAATPAAALDQFVTAWSNDALEADAWPAAVISGADVAAGSLKSGPDRFRDIRFSIVHEDGGRASAVAEAIHFERRDARFLWVFPSVELVPVADAQVLAISLVARPVELFGGGDIGAVRWELVDAVAP